MPINDRTLTTLAFHRCLEDYIDQGYTAEITGSRTHSAQQFAVLRLIGAKFSIYDNYDVKGHVNIRWRRICCLSTPSCNIVQTFCSVNFALIVRRKCPFVKYKTVSIFIPRLLSLATNQ